MSRDNWSNLIIEKAARPLPLADDRFRQWIAGKGIFISSRRDDEMNPSREAVRNYLHSIILGKTTEADRDTWDMAQSFTIPDTKALPEVLAETNAGGWLAEGLTKLYAVEEFKQRYPGYFEYLDISPATATGVRIDGSFVFESGTRSEKEVVIQGVVPLRS